MRRDKDLEYRTDDLDFSVRTYNCLRKARVETLGALIQYTEPELLVIRNFGRKSLTEVLEKLATFGLRLREDKDGLAAMEEDEASEDFSLDHEDDEVDEFLDA